jgi:hypothetical protein
VNFIVVRFDHFFWNSPTRKIPEKCLYDYIFPIHALIITDHYYEYKRFLYFLTAHTLAGGIMTVWSQKMKVPQVSRLFGFKK